MKAEPSPGFYTFTILSEPKKSISADNQKVPNSIVFLLTHSAIPIRMVDYWIESQYKSDKLEINYNKL